MSAEALKLLEKKTLQLANARELLETAQLDLSKILRDTSKEYMPDVRKYAERVANLQAELEALIEEHRAMFLDGTKTIVLNEITVGLKKATDTVEFDDEAETIKLIRAKLPELAGQLINTKETLALTGVKKLDAKQLSLIKGRTIKGVDEVVALPAKGEIDKMIKLLIPDAA